MYHDPLKVMIDSASHRLYASDLASHEDKVKALQDAGFKLVMVMMVEIPTNAYPELITVDEAYRKLPKKEYLYHGELDAQGRPEILFTTEPTEKMIERHNWQMKVMREMNKGWADFTDEQIIDTVKKNIEQIKKLKQ